MKKRAMSALVLLLLVGCTPAEPPAAPVSTQTVTAQQPVEAPTEAPTEVPAEKTLIVIDPGHQDWSVDMSATEPNAPGSAVHKAKASTGTAGPYSGTAEFALNLDISLALREELEARGYAVLLTREDNFTAISNMERAQLATQAGADFCIRIHANGSEDSAVSGALALVPSPQNPDAGALANESARLADCVLSGYCSATGFSNRGVQQNDTMTGLNWSTVPVMILEMGFMTNQSDDLQMADAAFRKTMVTGIADGIERYAAPEPREAETKETSLDGLRDTLQAQLPDGGERWSVCVLDLHSGEQLLLQNAPMQSASLIKLFVAGAVEENLVQQQTGAGETAALLRKMLSVSDNEATNTLVRRLGDGDAAAGMAAVNAFCAAHGYADTSMGRLMLDFEATSDNFTSAADCCAILAAIEAGQLTGAAEILEALRAQERTGKLPAGVPAGVETANKTGELDTVENDAALVWAEGRPYAVCVMSGSLSDPAAARARITALSAAVYTYMTT